MPNKYRDALLKVFPTSEIQKQQKEQREQFDAGHDERIAAAKRECELRRKRKEAKVKP